MTDSVKIYKKKIYIYYIITYRDTFPYQLHRYVWKILIDIIYSFLKTLKKRYSVFLESDTMTSSLRARYRHLERLSKAIGSATILSKFVQSMQMYVPMSVCGQGGESFSR